MPIKNEEAYLDECIASIIQQSYSHWELIAVNDHSEDRTTSILNSWSAKEDRIKVLHNQDHGIASALRLGYAQSTGSLIHRMDADDVMRPHKLERLMEKTAPGQVASGQVDYFSENTVGAGYKAFTKKMNNVLVQSSHHTHCFQECFLPSPSWMMRREDFERIGGFNIRMMPEDYDLYFRCLENELNIQATDQVVHLWRDHAARSSRHLPEYQTPNFIPLKVFYFLRIFRQTERPLVLWGAGRRGKAIASELLKKGQRFTWICDNPKKWSAPIYGKRLVPPSELYDLNKPQILVSISSPLERDQLHRKLEREDYQEGEDFWWFC